MTPGSFIRLGWHFFRRLVIRLVRRHDGLRRFEANYCREERLLPLAPEDRNALERFSRCIACGMCDAHFDAYDRVDPAAMQAPSDLPLSYSRSLPDYDALHRYLAGLRQGDLERLERVCPVGVPFRQLADFAERRATLTAPADAQERRDEGGPR